MTAKRSNIIVLVLLIVALEYDSTMREDGGLGLGPRLMVAVCCTRV
eukprot:COSAG05_NODE_3_length_51333_cov_129.132080_18_plen_46_part_00